MAPRYWGRLELAAGAIDARVGAERGTEDADDREDDEERESGHALTLPERDHQHKREYCSF